MATVLRKELRAIAGATVIVLVVLVVSATLVHHLESAAQPEIFGTIPNAMWWAMETLTTVGYGDAIPQTVLGRVVGAIVMFLGIGVFVMWTSIFAAAFLEEARKRSFVVTPFPLGLHTITSHLVGFGVYSSMNRKSRLE